MNPVEQTALYFVAKINAHDPESLAAAMTEHHEFVDSLGKPLTGRETMKQAWTSYFHWIPDYAIEIQQVFTRDTLVALFGFAGGTYAPDGKLLAKNRWRIPAAWLAVVDHERIAKWQVFADNKPMHDLLRDSPTVE